MTRPDVRVEDEETQSLVVHQEGAVAENKEAMDEPEAQAEASGRVGRGEWMLDRVAGDERRRFIIGHVLVPVIIALLVILGGAWINSMYQDRQDQRSRNRDLVSAVRENATVLFGHLENLEQRGRAIERIWSTQELLPLVQAVDEALRRLEGLAHALRSVDLDNEAISETLLLEIGACKRAVETYSDPSSTVCPSFAGTVARESGNFWDGVSVFEAILVPNFSMLALDFTA